MDVALPIITVNEAGDHFELNESNLQTVLDAVEKINANKVVILSVVGAFRTGKSLLLDFFLRYLRHSAEEDAEGVMVDARDDAGTELPAWMQAGHNFLKTARGDVDGLPGGIKGKDDLKAEATAAAPSTLVSRKKAKKNKPVVEADAAEAENDSASSTASAPVEETPAPASADTEQPAGFIWRPGKERTTTGIWMYGKPFIRELPETKERVAVVLMDTQGMFDFNTTKELTAAIFGLSTLISSYEIYNVTKQIQEDYLQQLHYFTEFSRVALKEFEQAQKRAEKKEKHGVPKSPLSSSQTFAGLRARKGADIKSASLPLPLDLSEEGKKELAEGPFSATNAAVLAKKKGKKGKAAAADEATAADDNEEKSSSANTMHPFQTLQFLVRDWANFSDDEDLEQCLSEMPKVLETAMGATVEDGGTRAQLRAAFEKIECFLLPHPGIPMTRPKYDGDVSAIERPFLRLLDNFVHQVFERGLVTKKIQGREVSPSSLFKYIKAYAGIFRDGKLPQTMTLVQAISVTTNLCAKDDSLKVYKEEMDKELGGDKYVSVETLDEVHTRANESAIEKFDSLAIFGEEGQIEETRSKLRELIAGERVSYLKTNDLKMQSGLQRFILPILAALIAFVLDRLTDYTCDAWSQSCRSLSLLFFYVYFVVFAMLCYQFYFIYKQQGGAAVGMSAMALGHATFQKVKSYQDLVQRGPADESRKKSQ